MKVRFLGHSCIEIKGQHHILVDPDFTHNPDPGVEYILVSHAHMDHIARIAEIPTGFVVASPDVCEIAAKLGLPEERLKPVKVGDRVGNIQILPGYSRVNDPIYTFFYVLFRMRLPDPGGTPLSFLIEDEANLLHIGDAHEAPLSISPDILCLPWRKVPFGPKKYKKTVVRMANQFEAKYVIPIHHDLPGTEADPAELNGHLNAEVLNGTAWHHFSQKNLERRN